MADISSMSLAKGDVFTTAHVQAINRVEDGYGYVSGCDVHQKAVPGMGVTVDAGVVFINNVYTAVSSGDLVIDNGTASPRFDIIYVNSSGIATVSKGTAAAIQPVGVTDFKLMSSPIPNAAVPAGVILARIYVEASETTSILNADIDDIAIRMSQVPLSILTTRGDIPVRNATTWTRLPKSATAGHSLLQGADDPYWGYPSHTTLTNIGTNAHSVIDTFIASKAAASGLASLDGSSVCAQNPKIHASRHQLGGADTIKLDDLAAPDNNTDLDATTSVHGLMPKFPNAGKQTLIGDKTWRTITWGVDFEFGDGSTVLVVQAKTSRCGVNACKINKAYIRSIDTTGALKTGSVTCSIHVHDYNAVIGSAVDTFVLSSASSYEETTLTGGTHLPLTIAAGKFVTVVLSGITDVTQFVLSLEFEAT